MCILGFFVATFLFFRVKHRLGVSVRDDAPHGTADVTGAGPASWHERWHREWADKFEQQAACRQERWEHYTRKWARKGEREARRWQRRAERHAKKWGVDVGAPPPPREAPAATEDEVRSRARRRAIAEAGFYGHLMSYLRTAAVLALITLMTTRYPWFLWPAPGWRIGIFSPY